MRKPQPSDRQIPRRRVLKHSLLASAGLYLNDAIAQPRDNTLRIAVASNFRPVLDVLLNLHAPENLPSVTVSSASTGVLFQQIRFGAPFDLFLAADQLRPQTLYKAGIGHQPKRYCRGRLALLSRHENAGNTNRPAIQADHHIALADPKLAPYGLAADALLSRWQVDTGQRLLASNTAQALQWFTQGKADWALLPLSLAKQAKLTYQLIDAALHPDIDQYGQRLNDKPAALAFEQWLLSERIQTFIVEQGYAAVTDKEDHS